MKSLFFSERVSFFLLVVFSFVLNAKEGFSRLSIFLAIFFVFLLFLKKGKIFLIRDYVLPIIFLIFNTFSLFWGGNIDYVMQVSSAIIIGYAVFAGLKYGVPISILVWGMVVAAILNIAFSYENIGYFHRFEASRPAGLIGNANALAIFLSFVAFLLYFLTSKKRLLIKCIVFFLLYFVFFFTGSRKGLLLVAMIILLIGIDYLIWQKARISPKRCMVVFLVLVIFLGFCFTKFSVISKDVLGVQRVEALLRGEDRWSAQTRYLMIDQATNLWLEKPFLGWGGGGFAINSGFGTYSHNNYVELLSNYGLVGFCLYYAFYVYLFAIGWSLRKEYLSRVGFLIIIMLFILEWGFVSLGDKTSWILLGIAAHCIIPYRGVI